MKKIFLLLFCGLFLNGCMTSPQLMSWMEGTVYLNTAGSASGLDPAACTLNAATGGPNFWPCSVLNSGYYASTASGSATPAACASIAESFMPNCGQGQPLSFVPVTAIVGNISGAISAATITIYNGIIGNTTFQTILRITLTMFIALYGIAIMFGIANPSPHEFIMRLVKFGIIVAITTTGGWNNFFGPYIYNFFMFGTNWLVTTMMAAFNGGGAGPYCANPNGVATLAIDEFLSRFMNRDYWRTVIAISFTGWPFNIGMLIGVLMVVMAFIYVIAVLHAVYLWIVALVALGLLFAIAPIFFIFLLFGHTRQMFEGWLKQVINFSLQPVFVLAFLAFFNGMITQMLLALLGGSNYMVCYYQTFRISLGQFVSNWIPQILGGLIGQFFTWLGGFIDDCGIPVISQTVSAINGGFWLATAPVRAIFSGVPSSIGGVVTAIGNAATGIADAISALTAPLGQLLDSILPVWNFYWWGLFNVSTAGVTLGNAPGYPVLQNINNVGVLPQNALMSSLPGSFTISAFLLVILLCFLMYKMGSWAQGIASQISDGLMILPSAAPGVPTAGAMMQQGAVGGANMLGKAMGGGGEGGGGGGGSGGSTPRPPAGGDMLSGGGEGGGGGGGGGSTPRPGGGDLGGALGGGGAPPVPVG